MNTLTKVVSTLYPLKQTILNITWMRIFCLTWKHKHKIKGGGKSYLVYETSFLFCLRRNWSETYIFITEYAFQQA